MGIVRSFAVRFAIILALAPVECSPSRRTPDDPIGGAAPSETLDLSASPESPDLGVVEDLSASADLGDADLTNAVTPDLSYVAPPDLLQVQWDRQATGVTVNLNAIWGSAPDDLYVVGNSGTILHSVGDGVWTAQPTGVVNALFGIWGSGANDIYAVGAGRTILHSTGNGVWTAQVSPAASPGAILSQFHLAVWGSSANDVYVVGSLGEVSHSSGDGVWRVLQVLPPGVANNIRIKGLFGRAANDVYIGVNEKLYHRGDASDAGVFVAESAPVTPDAGTRIAGVWANATDLVAVGSPNDWIGRRSGTQWSNPSTPLTTTILNAVWGRGDEIIAVGSFGTVLRSEDSGATWALEDVNLEITINGVWGAATGNHIYAVASNGVVFKRR